VKIQVKPFYKSILYSSVATQN